MPHPGQTATNAGTASATARGAAVRAPGVRDAVIPVHPFTGLLNVAIENGWRGSEMLSDFEFDRDGRVLPGQHVSYLQAREMILRAQHRVGPQAAAASGARKSLPNLGVMGLGLLAQSSLGDALEFGLKYQRLAGAMLNVTLKVQGDEASVIVGDLFGDDELRGFLDVDHLLACTNSLMLLPAQAFSLQRVELEGDASPELVARLSQEFKCPVLPHAEVSRAVFDAQHLKSGLRFADPVTAELSRQTCERELQALGLATAAKPVRDYLVGPDGSLRSPAEMASEIGVSARTVHRMLAADGLKYADLADELRIEQARRLLRRGLSTDAVAEALDYSDARSFRRAFERWTGETPARFRERR